MLILSKLIVKAWFKSLIGAVTVLFLLISTADLINHFLQGKEASQAFMEYALKMPDLMSKMFPICCLVASLFSLNHLKSHAELISILAAGFSYKKIYLLIASCSLTVVAVQFVNLGFAEPYANKVKRQQIQKSQKSEGRYLTRSSIEGGKFWYKSQNYFASFSYFDRKQNILLDLDVYYFSPLHSSAKIYKSKKASFIDNRKWLLEEVTEFDNLDTPAFPLQLTKKQTVLQLEEVPDDFGEFEADLTTLNFFKLGQFISRLTKTGLNVSEYQVILLNKIFLSFICLVFALIPVSTIFNPNRRSSSFGMNVVLTLLVTIVFWVLYSSSVAFGNSGSLSPWLATGIVPMGFFSFVLISFFRNRKLSI